MGSSKKHKKQKDKKHSLAGDESSQSFTSTPAEQRPLKLVLKVSGAASASSPHMSPSVTFSEYEMLDPNKTGVTYESGYVVRGSDDGGRSSHGSGKKSKKSKKSKKKHRKHSHHHSHHHHSHHHHRHHGSRSHHSKCSSSSPSAAAGEPGELSYYAEQPPLPAQLLSPSGQPANVSAGSASSMEPTGGYPFSPNQPSTFTGIQSTVGSPPQTTLAALACNQPLPPSFPTLGDTLNQMHAQPAAVAPQLATPPQVASPALMLSAIKVETSLPTGLPGADMTTDEPSAVGLSSPLMVKSEPTVMQATAASTSPSAGAQMLYTPSMASAVPSCSPPLSRAPIGLKPLSKSPLQSLLQHLVKQIEKRDPQEFFAWPVTDQIAPGYSAIITRPIDLSTIRQKIASNRYPSVTPLRADVKLMCDNAMTYNRPDTVYYKAARKLWHHVREKLFQRDALLELVKLYQGVTNYELGLTCADYNDADQAQFGGVGGVIPPVPPAPVTNGVLGIATVTPVPGSVPIPAGIGLPPTPMVSMASPIVQPTPPPPADIVWNGHIRSPVENSAEQILAEASRAARAAADRLSMQKPNGAHFALVRQQPDGSTSLAIVGGGGAGPTATGEPAPAEISLQAVVGKLNDGHTNLPPFRESDLAIARPMETVSSSSFSSYLPSVSSAKASLTAEESGLLLSTYGQSELGLAYSHSLLQFAGDSDYVMNMVDSLLDVLTAGAHSKLLTKMKADEAADLPAKRQRVDAGEKDEAAPAASEAGDAETMDTEAGQQPGDAVASEPRTLDIEMEEIDKAISMELPDVDHKLAETSGLLSQLEQVQKQRLSSGPMPTKPCKEELRIAQMLSEKLATLIGSYTAPTDITDIKAIRSAMGVQMKTEIVSS